MAVLTLKDKILIDRLVGEGKTCKEIKERLNVYSYANIWNYVNRAEISRKEKEKRAKKIRERVRLQTGKYVPTGAVMPPINPPIMVMDVVDKELAEQACRDMGLEPPVTTLANKPANFNRNGLQWDGKTWVSKPNLHTEGQVSYEIPLFVSNTWKR